MKSTPASRRLLFAIALGWALWPGGCQDTTVSKSVPAPISDTLPHAIHIHPFTGGKRQFDSQGGIQGIEVQIEAKDAYGDTTKAFGDFRFELYYCRKVVSEPRGERIEEWEVSVMDPNDNRVHWSEISRTYEFRLQWDKPAPVGDRLVLVATFSSPYTQRLFDEYTFVSGE